MEPVGFVVQLVAGQAFADVWRRGRRALSRSDAERVLARTRAGLLDRLPATSETEALAGWVVSRLADPVQVGGPALSEAERNGRSGPVRRIATQLAAVDAHVFEVTGDWQLPGAELLARLGMDVESLAERVADALIAAVRELAAAEGGLPETLRQYDSAQVSAQLDRIERGVSGEAARAPRGVPKSQFLGSWWCTGARLADSRPHFEARGRGQRRRSRGGDMFRGRASALATITGWLTARECPGRVLVVTGRPGAGKSAVVARTVLNHADLSGFGRAGLAFHARDATSGDVVRALAVMLGVVAAGESISETEVLRAAEALPDEDDPALLIVDALDEAAELERQAIAELLCELAVLPGWRVVAATRSANRADLSRSGGMLDALGVRERDSGRLVDLEAEAYQDPDGLRAFAAALLTQQGATHPGPSGAAWQRYRRDPALTSRLAGVIADRADGNFLVAALAAAPLSERDVVVDPSLPGFDPNEIPARVGEALDKYVDRLPAEQRVVERLLLTALAYARGTGLDDETWLGFARMLGNTDRIDGLDLERLRASPAVDYLLYTSHPDGGTVTRLFHQALADQLQADRSDPAADHASIAMLLLDKGTKNGWTGYVVAYLAEHAAIGGQLDRLVAYVDYLLHVDPARLLPLLGHVQGEEAALTAMAYRQTAHQMTRLTPEARASHLELVAHRLGHSQLAEAIAETAPDRPWETVWSHGQPSMEHVFAEHDAPVEALVSNRLPSGTGVVLSSGGRWGVRAWDADTGQPIGLPMARFPPMTTMGIAKLRDGRTVAFGCGAETVITAWCLESGERFGSPVSLHQDLVVRVASGYLRDGTPVGISGGKDGTVRCWNLETGQAIGEPEARHDGRVTALAVATLRHGAQAAVSGGRDGTLRVWNLETGRASGAPLGIGTTSIRALVAARMRDGTPIVVAGIGEHVQVWNLETRTTIGLPLTSGGATRPVAVTVLADGTPMLVSEVHGVEVLVSSLESGQVIEQYAVPPNNGTGPRTIAIAQDRTPVVVSGGNQGTLRVRRLEGEPLSGRRLMGHEARVTSIRTKIARDGTPAVVSTSVDGARRVWNAETGTPLDHAAVAESGPYDQGLVAFTTLPNGTFVELNGHRDGWVGVRDMETGSLLQRIDTSGPDTRLSSGQRLPSFDPLYALATAILDDDTTLMISATGRGARVWPLGTNDTPEGLGLERAPKPTRAIATITMPGGRGVVVGGGDDGVLRLWDPRTRRRRGVPLHLGTEPVTALTFDGDLLFVATGTNISAHRVRA